MALPDGYKRINKTSSFDDLNIRIMATYDISIMACGAEAINLHFESSDPSAQFSLHPLIQDLKTIFTLNPMQPDGSIIIGTVEDAHYNNVAKLAKLYEKDNIPQLKALPSRFKQFNKGAHYAIVINRPLSTQESVILMTQLESMDKDISAEDLYKKIDDTCGEVLRNYEFIGTDGTNRMLVGPSKRSERICRYCHRSMPDVTFDKIAHTISEGLENKNIITNDECDVCNEYFGREVEPHLLEFVSVFRVLFNIQGKKGKIHHAFGENYEIINNQDDHNSISLDVHTNYEKADEIPDITESPLELTSQKEIIMQNVYKTLVKYALGILQETRLAPFANTFDWLLGKTTAEKLPLVRLSIGTTKVAHPSVMVFIRKSSDTTLPFAMAELNVINLKFSYIIPMFDGTDVQYLSNECITRIDEVFKGYAVTSWQIKDFSTSKPVKLNTKIYFEKMPDTK